MDFSNITQRDREAELRVKSLLELATKKYNLQKELEAMKARLVAKEGELSQLKKEVVSLKLEVPVLERQEEIAKRTAQDLKKQLAEKSEEVGKIQESIWRKINNFIADANARPPPLALEGQGKDGGREARQYKIRQLKVESEIEAMHLYEKYQSRRMEELKLMRDLLGEGPHL